MSMKSNASTLLGTPHEKHHPHDLEAGPESDHPASPLNNAQDNDTIKDPNIVDWDGPNDPANPRNWAQWKKVINILLVSAMCLLTPIASSMFAPGVPKLMEDFHSTNKQLATFVVSVFVLGMGIGPMIVGPLSEIYGRLPIYLICNALFVVFTIACGLSTNINMLTGFRFLAGFAGSAPICVGGGTIADLIAQEHRGAAMAAFGLGPMLGPIIGPIAGGYLAQAEGWKWVFWVIAIAGALMVVLYCTLMSETYPVILLERKAAKLRKQTGNQALRSKLTSTLSPAIVIRRGIERPMKLLVLSPIVLALSVFQGICFGCLYLLFTTFSEVFTKQYHWSTGSDGLSFLGLGVGMALSLVFFGRYSDPLMKRMAGKGEMKPEYRLVPMIPATLLITGGLFWYGWSIQAGAHWIVPILGTGLVGFGYMPVILAIMTYLVDAFELWAASAMAASTILRSIMGALIPLAGESMYDAMGYGWGNSLLGFITLAMLPFPTLFFKYGERMRKSRKLDL